MTFPGVDGAVMEALSVIGKFPSALNTYQINHRHHKHPDEINEMPVQAGGFDMPGGQRTASVSAPNYDQRDDAADDVQQMQPGNAEEGSSEKRRAPSIVEWPDTFADQPKPFSNVQPRERKSTR